MRTIIVALFALAASAGLAHAGNPVVKVETTVIDADAYSVVITVPYHPGEDQMASVVKPRLIKLCAGRPMRFVKAESITSPDRETQRFEQTIRCGGDSAAGPPGSEVADSWRPTAADNALVQDLTRRALSDQAKRDYDAFYRRVDPLAAVEQATVARFFEVLASDAPPKDEYRLERAQWSINDRANPYMGAYALVKFDMASEHGLHICGHLVWYRRADGDYRILSLNETGLPVEQACPKG